MFPLTVRPAEMKIHMLFCASIFQGHWHESLMIKNLASYVATYLQDME